MKKRILNQSGQGMTEYIIIVAVIALAAIAAFTYFGKTVREQTAAMSSSLAGDKSGAQTHIKDADSAAKKAGTNADQTLTLKNYDKGQVQGQ